MKYTPLYIYMLGFLISFGYFGNADWLRTHNPVTHVFPTIGLSLMWPLSVPARISYVMWGGE